MPGPATFQRQVLEPLQRTLHAASGYRMVISCPPCFLGGVLGIPGVVASGSLREWKDQSLISQWLIPDIAFPACPISPSAKIRYTVLTIQSLLFYYQSVPKGLIPFSKAPSPHLHQERGCERHLFLSAFTPSLFTDELEEHVKNRTNVNLQPKQVPWRTHSSF